MTPTMNLRFAKRYEGDKVKYILQQMWVSDYGTTEWHDVPLVDLFV